MDDDVDYFMMVTEVTSQDVARGYLQISGGDVSTAIQTFYEHPEFQSSFAAAHSTSTAAAHNLDSSARAPSSRLTGREDSHGVVHIDSDDDDDILMADDDNNIDAIARNIQEDEDAAMARQLQEELSGSGSGAISDGVRAPIAQTTETLAGPDLAWSPVDEDREAGVIEQLRARQSRQRRQSKHIVAYSGSIY